MELRISIFTIIYVYEVVLDGNRKYTLNQFQQTNSFTANFNNPSTSESNIPRRTLYSFYLFREYIIWYCSSCPMKNGPLNRFFIACCRTQN